MTPALASRPRTASVVARVVLAASAACAAPPALADTAPRATLRYDVTLQRCEEPVPGLRNCASATASATPRTLVLNGSAVGLAWNEVVPLPTALGDARAILDGALAVVERPGGDAVCLSALTARLDGVSDRAASAGRETCVDLDGGSAPVFLFASWRLEDAPNDPTFALSVTGTLSSTGD